MKRVLYPGLFVLIFGLLMSACQGAAKNPVKTSFPRYVPGQALAFSLVGISSRAPESCQVRAVDLIGAWVTAKYPETDPFPFTALEGKTCRGTFQADVLPLFSQANLWYAGAPSCRTCHGPDVTVSYARLDLSSYQGILAGSGRESADKTGDDILGGGNWDQAKLHQVFTDKEMPPNQPEGLDPLGPIINAGSSK
jgi:hypothetical protein